VSLVKLDKGESLDKALRRFKRKIQRDGILRDLRDREFYEKPSQKKRKKQLKALKKVNQSKRKHAQL